MLEIKTGVQFGRLVVVKELAPVRVGQDKKTKRVFELQCACGNTTTGKLASLRNGSKKSCGCLQREVAAEHCRITRPKPSGEAMFNVLLSSYQQGAKRRGHVFALTVEQFKGLVTSNCFYCGQPPLNVMRREQMNGAFVYNGIDRRDNVEGYTVENTVACCSICNRAKHAMGFEAFRAWIARVYQHIYT